MARSIYIVGLLVSIMGICLWPVILRSQIKQFNGTIDHNKVKTILLAFAAIALLTNIAPGIYDVYRIIHPSSPGPISFLKIASDIIFRATATGAFFLIYWEAK